ncbi:ATP-binding protein [Cupriavidus basilensis]
MRRCRDAWRTQGSLDALPDSGRAGLSGFALPTALYGRARELDVLRQLHREATEQGGPAPAASYVLVTGCAGSGKSALAEAFCRSLGSGRRRGGACEGAAAPAGHAAGGCGGDLRRSRHPGKCLGHRAAAGLGGGHGGGDRGRCGDVRRAGPGVARPGCRAARLLAMRARATRKRVSSRPSAACFACSGRWRRHWSCCSTTFNGPTARSLEVFGSLTPGTPATAAAGDRHLPHGCHRGRRTRRSGLRHCASTV